MKTAAGSRDTASVFCCWLLTKNQKKEVGTKRPFKKKSFLSVRNENFSLPQTYQVLGRGGAWITALPKYEKISLQDCKQYRAEVEV